MAARRNRPTGNTPPRDPAMYELMKQSLEQAKTATSMATAIEGNTQHSLLMLDRIHNVLESMSTGSGGPGGGGQPLFPGAGGYGGGPNGGRPLMPANQSGRPSMGPQGYPGGPGYGMNGQIFPGYGSGYRAGGMGGALGLAQVAAARFVHNTRGAGQGGAVSYQRQSDGSYHAHDAMGNVVETGISEATVRHRAEVSTAAGAAGSSGSILGAIKSIPVAGKIVGAALVGLESAQKLGNFIGDQRAANAQYQAIYGPGTSGFDQRMHNFGGRYRNLMSNLGSAFGIGDGGLADADYDKAFKGVSAMGFQGGDRNNMIGFATKNFNRMGMSVDESLQLIGINAKEASTNFATLGEQLRNVSQMAQSAGQSAEVFRQSFIQSYGTAVGAGFGGSSGTIATAQVASTVGQGRLFSGLNTSAMYGSIGAQQILAGREGFGSVLDFDLAGQANPMVIANAQQKSLNQVFQAVVPADVRKLVEVSIQKNGGSSNVANNQNRALTVVKEVEQQRPGSLNSIAIIQAMRTAGIAGAENLDPTAAAIYYVQWVAKQGKNFTEPTARAMAANDQRTGAAAVAGAVTSDLANRAMGGSRDLSIGSINGHTVVDPIIGKMQADKVGYVQVQTANGSALVSLSDAARDFRDQLASGSAIIASGPNAGQTVGAIYGKEQHQKYKSTTSAKTHDGVFDSKTWKSIQDLHLTDSEISDLAHASKTASMFGGNKDKVITQLARNMAEKNAKATGGTVTIGMKPELARYFEITTTGDNLVNRAASSGAPPSINSTGSSTGH